MSIPDVPFDENGLEYSKCAVCGEWFEDGDVTVELIERKYLESKNGDTVRLVPQNDYDPQVHIDCLEYEC